MFGVDFLKNCSSVINYITPWILLFTMIYFGFLARDVDVKSTFLHRERQEEFNIDRLAVRETLEKMAASFLGKIIDDLMQSVRYYNTYAIEILKIGFSGGKVKNAYM